jgi:hypothetical protein
MAKWNKVGSVWKSKNGNSYVRFDKDVSFTSSQLLQLRDPKESLRSLFEKGKINKEQYEERIFNLPEKLVRDIFLVEEN